MDKKTKELILFHINEKANAASKMMNNVKPEKDIQFWRGQSMAFNEVYSMIKNIEHD